MFSAPLLYSRTVLYSSENRENLQRIIISDNIRIDHPLYNIRGCPFFVFPEERTDRDQLTVDAVFALSHIVAFLSFKPRSTADGSGNDTVKTAGGGNVNVVKIAFCIGCYLHQKSFLETHSANYITRFIPFLTARSCLRSSLSMSSSSASGSYGRSLSPKTFLMPPIRSSAASPERRPAPTV